MLPLKDENPISIFPVITILLIGLNLLVFYLQFTANINSEKLFFSFGLIPYEIINKKLIYNLNDIYISPYLKLFTSMFMHGGFMHISGNMLYLWIFGNNIEEFLGHTRYLFFYIFCGLTAALVHVFFNPNSKIPMVGASGAVSGILGAYLLLYPRAKVLTLIFIGFFIKIVRLPAVFLLGLWVFLQILNGTLAHSADEGGVAWFAHIGGFATGLLIIFLIRKPRYKRL